MRLVKLGLAGVAMLVVACGPNSEELMVSTAASLGGAFSDLEATFEDRNPEVDVVLNIGGSATLSYQVIEGAPIDVLASADEDSIAEVLEEGFASAPPNAFASNRLQIVVPAGNPGEITGLESLTDEGLLVGACAEVVPCGRLAAAVLSDAEIEIDFATLEPNVRAVLDKVAIGELDAGLVYVTDLVPDVEAIAIESDRANLYPIIVVSDRQVAEDFASFVISDAGQAILASHGFGPP